MAGLRTSRTVTSRTLRKSRRSALRRSERLYGSGLLISERQFVRVVTIAVRKFAQSDALQVATIAGSSNRGPQVFNRRVKRSPHLTRAAQLESYLVVGFHCFSPADSFWGWSPSAKTEYQKSARFVKSLFWIIFVGLE